MSILVSKIGAYHIENGINNQDFGFVNAQVKCVLDGCSEGKHSEVGAKLFSKFYLKEGIEKFGDIATHQAYLLRTLSNMKEGMCLASVNDIVDYLCFTTLMVHQSPECIVVDTVGDGFIIAQTQDDAIDFIELSSIIPNSPPYLAYNLIPSGMLLAYKDGVKLQRRIFDTTLYKNVGVATDGLRFVLKDPVLTEEFVRLLLKGKETPLKLFINRNQKVFQDDITIAL